MTALDPNKCHSDMTDRMTAEEFADACEPENFVLARVVHFGPYIYFWTVDGKTYLGWERVED